jgi:integrase
MPCPLAQRKEKESIMSGNITRRGKSSWRLKYELPRDPKTGKRQTRYQTVRGTKREANDKLIEIQASVRNRTYVEATKLTLGEFVENWLTLTIQVSPKTFERYADLARGHIVPNIGAIMLQQLTATDIEGLYRDLREQGRRKGKGLSARTVLHVHRLLTQILKSAVKKRHIERSPMEDVEAVPKPEDAEIEVLTDDQLATLLRSLKGKRLYMPVLLGASTGMRRGEILGLHWSDIDFDRQVLSVTHSLEETKAELRLKKPKTKHSRREIALPSSTVEALRYHRVKQAEERLALGLGRNENGLVFLSPLGEPIRPRNFTKEFSRQVTVANIGKVTFHGLRHTHITHLLKSGVPIKVVSERAGHANITITLSIYAHVLPNMQEDAAAVMDASLQAIENDAGTN